MFLKTFEYHTPANLEEALNMLASLENAVLKAGGTDLLVEMKKGLRNHEHLICIQHLPELKKIEKEGDKIIIGASVTHNEIKNSELIKKHIPALYEAVQLIGSEQIRNLGTIGGNICNASACADTAPVLTAMDARVIILSLNGEKTVAIKDFFVHNRRTILEKGEIVKEIQIPVTPSHAAFHYEKFGLRDGSAISVASVATGIFVSGSKITKAVVVMGAVAPVPVSSKAFELLFDKDINQVEQNEELLQQIAEKASQDAVPISDVRGKAEYRRHLVGVLTRRALLKTIQKLKSH